MEALEADDSAVMLACLRLDPIVSDSMGCEKDSMSDADNGGMMATVDSDAGGNNVGGNGFVGEIRASFTFALDRLRRRDLAFRCAECKAVDCGKREIAEGEGETGGIGSTGGRLAGDRGVIIAVGACQCNSIISQRNDDIYQAHRVFEL